VRDKDFTQAICHVSQPRGTADGKVFEDTKERGKPIVFRYGSRPITGGLCQGVEEALSTMRAGAGTCSYCRDRGNLNPYNNLITLFTLFD